MTGRDLKMAKTNEKYEALKGMREIEAKFRSTDSLEIETLFFSFV